MGAERRLRVLVVDDHEIVNWGFRVLLTREPWVERCVIADSGTQALAYARRYQPHVALVDVFLGEESGVDVARALRQAVPGTRILLTSGATKVSNKAVRSAGAFGYVSKSWRPDDLARAIRMVGLGLKLSPPEADESAAESQLTPRERKVLELIARGRTNGQIAADLCLSLHTVKQHASAIFRKLDVHNRAEAVQTGERLGYLA
jgi:DNA-binding NarL/FixJ family response regulator